jgi:hypothetical protein
VVRKKQREERMLAAIRRVLDRDETIVDRGRCWGAVRRPHTPLLFLRRRQYDVVLTDRRIVLFSRRAFRPDDLVLVKRFTALSLASRRLRPTLVQHRIHTDAGRAVVLEWDWRNRRLGSQLAQVLEQSTPRSS